MDVHVHLGRRHLQEDDRARIAPVRHQLAVGAQDGVCERAVADGAAIHEQPDIASAAVLDGGRYREPVGTDGARCAGEGHQPIAHFAPERFLGSPGQKVGPGVELRERPIAFANHERDVRARQGEPEHGLEALRLLRLRFLQELAPGGNVPEQVAHFDRGAMRQAGAGDARRRATLDLDSRALQRSRLAGEQRETADRRHAGERFAAKPVAGDGEEIVLAAQLARGVTLQAQPGILASHAAAVVADAHQASAAVLEVDLDPLRAGIEGVLDQLLHHRSGALDHLPRGDLVRERRIEQVDPRHRHTVAGHGV